MAVDYHLAAFVVETTEGLNQLRRLVCATASCLDVQKTEHCPGASPIPFAYWSNHGIRNFHGQVSFFATVGIAYDSIGDT
jgi:hypothetical protein